MKHTLLLLSFFFFQLILMAQMVDNSKGITNLRDIPFDPAFIRNHNIESIQCSFSEKMPNRAIEDRGETTRYSFTQMGQVNKVQKIKRILAYHDTSYHELAYNHEGLLIQLESIDNHNLSREVYQYEQNKQVAKEIYAVREDSADTTLISREVYTYQVAADGSEVCTTFNNAGLPYMQQMVTCNPQGYLEKVEDKLLVTGDVHWSQYGYNLKGWVSTLLLSGKLRPDINYFYNYDSEGNLKLVTKQIKGITKNTLEILYNDQRLIHSFILHDTASGMMQIGKFYYTFFPVEAAAE